jgi:hypothetical protein
MPSKQGTDLQLFVLDNLIQAVRFCYSGCTVMIQLLKQAII